MARRARDRRRRRRHASLRAADLRFGDPGDGRCRRASCASRAPRVGGRRGRPLAVGRRPAAGRRRAARARRPRVLLTSGRQGLAAFAGDDTTWFLIRCVDPPDAAVARAPRGPARSRSVHARGGARADRRPARRRRRDEGQRRSADRGQAARRPCSRPSRDRRAPPTATGCPRPCRRSPRPPPGLAISRRRVAARRVDAVRAAAVAGLDDACRRGPDDRAASACRRRRGPARPAT